MNKNNSLNFSPFDQEQLASYVSLRDGETKLGELVQFEVSESTQFVILGISEDIGPRANNGNGGANNAFDAFLSKFLNMQSNRFLSGENIAILGTIQAQSHTNNVNELRKKVTDLDDLVIGTLSKVDFSDKQLIVIGGGHNNAYPIMKALSEQYPALHILNIDPHADCRSLEGRHSGNPFSTAIFEKIITSYSVFGLHEQYNSKAIYEFLEENNCSKTFFEDYLDGRLLSEDLAKFTKEKGSCFGLEVDLDSIERMPTSAFTPSGFTLNEIRTAVRQLSSEKPVYLHLPEGAPKTNEEKTIVGKALAYLVTDFIKSTRK
ncbi:MAG: arginase [Fluviicola sp.]|nr:MAG: arginase [Fluviicola sp.]